MSEKKMIAVTYKEFQKQTWVVEVDDNFNPAEDDILDLIFKPKNGGELVDCETLFVDYESIEFSAPSEKEIDEFNRIKGCVLIREAREEAEKDPRIVAVMNPSKSMN